MKLNKLKYVELVRKGIYSQELHHYSALCKMYENLLKSNSKSISKSDIERTLSKYAPLLEAAAKGDYSYLDSNYLSPAEVDVFKNFAYHSQKLNQYKEADTLLKTAIDVDAVTQRPMLSSVALQNFNSFMEKPLDCETNPKYIPTFQNQNYLQYHTSTKFMKLIETHSPRWLGHTFFKTSKNALDVINHIDSSHLPTGLQISENLTPASFGAEITGFIGNVQRFFEKFKKKDKSVEYTNEIAEQSNGVNIDDFAPFTQREQDYFRKKPTNLHEKAYNFVTARSGSLSKAAKAVAIFGTIIIVAAATVPSIAQTRNFNSATEVSQVQINEFTTPMSIEELNNVTNDFESQQYTNIADFKEDANYTLDAIQQTCQTYLNQYQLPTVDELKSILINLDDVTSMLIEKPVELAYQEKYPDFSNFKADLYYNDTVTDYRNLNNRITEEGVKVTATDPNGNEISTEIPNIGSPLGSNDLFKRVLKQERNYDQKYETLFEALSNPNAINPNTGKTYTYSEKSELCNKFFADIMQDCEVARTLTTPDVVIQPDGTFKFVIPEIESPEVETQSTTSNTTVVKEYIETEDGTTSVRYVEDDNGR